MKTVKVNIEPGSAILGTYKNQSYKLESALAEFIDNSTQSFFNNRDTLRKLGQTCCEITIEIYPDIIKVVDNAFGMEIDDYSRALKLKSPPSDTSGRSEKGMGLKTAATCLGAVWSVETTKYGSANKYFCKMDVNDIEENSPTEVSADVSNCDEEEHYTILEIKDLSKHRKITEAKITSLKKILSEMYSKDIRNGDLILVVNKEQVKYEPPAIRINKENNSEYKKEFECSFTVAGNQYKFDGWVGIRQTANTEFSGFTLYRKGRAIKINYRPSTLLGKPNSYPYQRIIGEVNLRGDNWEPSYTKDELMWEGEIEDTFIEKLKNASLEMINISAKLRKDDKGISEEKIAKTNTNVRNTFRGTQITSQTETQTSTYQPSSEPNSGIMKEEAEITTSAPQCSTDKENAISINIDTVDYVFYVTYKDNAFDEGIKLTYRNGDLSNDKKEFNLCINIGLPFFGENNKTQKEIEMIQKMAITFCAGIVSSLQNGKDKDYRTLKMINDIMITSGRKE